MNPPEVNAPPPPAIPPAPQAKPPRRSRWLGSLVALVLVGLVGGAAWYLVNRANSDSSEGPPGRGGPGGGRAMVTVGDAVARKADLPVIVDALGTVIPATTIARQDVDTQAALVKQLEGTVMTDKAQEGTARLNLDYTRITSPATGRIGLRAVDPGNYVTSGDATGIATITQVAPIDVQFSVPQDRVGDIRAAQGEAGTLAVTALDRGRKAELGKGQFSTLDNQVDTTTGTVKAKARFDNADGALFPNQFVNVQLLLRNVPAVVVPVTAVRTGANGDYVYVINEDRTVSLRKVKRGQATVGLMAIAEGLTEGERVVTEGGDRLQDGMAVQLPGAQAVRAPRAGASGPRSGASGPRGERGERGEGGQRRQRPPQNP
ncbi:MAG: efflux RND transporter periplasmic adaptor subunit [Acidovorax sp.]|nr:MAG: efflux RND transporter periplasmic adaptor subunit [Acidovorax sp.]